MPITVPTRKTCPSSHDGHHRVGAAVAPRPDGAAAAIAIAVNPTNTDQEARAIRQSPCAAGSTPNGVVKTVGMVSPTRTPLLKTAVATAIRRGNHSRTSAGNAGWLTATPAPMRNVAEKRIVALEPAPLSAPQTATAPSPMTNAAR